MATKVAKENDTRPSRINDALFEIHRDIAANLCASKLAAVSHYSEQHFHRVFYRVVGENVHAYIRRVRLEQAANQLTFDTKQSVQDIALKCGFASLSSFGRAFKNQFGASPGAWRCKEKRPGQPAWLNDPEIAAGYRRIEGRSCPTHNIVERPEIQVAYVRHLGYGRDIRNAWLRLKAWALLEKRDFSRQLGIHHSNPEWIAPGNCRYVACLEIDKPLLRHTAVNTLTIPAGLYAVFELQGVYGELLPWVSKILQEWLPASGFKLQTTPSFVEYKKNHFLAEDERFEVRFYLPIGFM